MAGRPICAPNSGGRELITINAQSSRRATHSNAKSHRQGRIAGVEGTPESVAAKTEATAPAASAGFPLAGGK